MSWFLLESYRFERMFAVAFHDVDKFPKHVMSEQGLGCRRCRIEGECWSLEEREKLGRSFSHEGLSLLV